jgi:subtilase family serine protease
VGGTSLVGTTESGWSETAWEGAGSGCSAVEKKPSWQHDSGCVMRTVADVSAVADPNTGVAVYDSYGSKRGANWYVLGGTSVAAPLIAGMWAHAVAAPASEPAATLYVNAIADASVWNDVTVGSNGDCGSYLCTAAPGFDGPTGLGTPNGLAGFGG